jgi:hypothetical protein
VGIYAGRSSHRIDFFLTDAKNPVVTTPGSDFFCLFTFYLRGLFTFDLDRFFGNIGGIINNNNMIKSGIEKIIGKTINAVVVTELTGPPHHQLFLVFTDGTNLEFYGDSIQCANDLGRQDVDGLVSYAKHNHATKIRVFDKEE